VRGWRGKNRALITDEMVVNAPRQIETFRELGRMEEARVRHNQLNPKTPLTQVRFVEENKSKYPTLREAVVRQPKENIKKQKEIKPKATAPKPKPRVLFPSRTQKDTPKPIEVKPKSKPKIKLRVLPKVEKEKKRIKTQKAREVHQSTWEKSKTVKPRSGIKIKTSKGSKPRLRTVKEKHSGGKD